MRHKNLHGSAFKPTSIGENDQRNFYKMKILQNTQNSLKSFIQIHPNLTCFYKLTLILLACLKYHTMWPLYSIHILSYKDLSRSYHIYAYPYHIYPRILSNLLHISYLSHGLNAWPPFI